ncbi:MAG TPA: hypothetical protein VLJ86_26540 [Ramlibacter sp.]|nr:hypothetical protein [Ramlibacter sp.]
MIIRTLIAAATLLALAACSDKPQTASGVKTDTAPFSGTGMAYVQPGWKPGDKTSWEQQLRTRGQGQNEYAKIN